MAEKKKALTSSGVSIFLEQLKKIFATKDVATTSSNGLMTSAMLTKLNGIANNANNYTHPTTAGNKHIPSGGSSGQILRWSADGTAVWGADNNTTYTNMVGASASAAGKTGLVPAPSAGKQLSFLRGDGTWVVPTNTTYTTGSGTISGLTKLYTATGSATDGTMTQKAITDALGGKAASSHTHNVSDISGTLPLSKGGTGATTNTAARSNLGAINILEASSEPSSQNVGDIWLKVES